MPPARHSRRGLTWLVRGASILVIGGLLYAGWQWYTSTDRITVALLADSQPNGELKNRQGQVEGLATAEATAAVHRVKYEANLPATDEGESYHGWLYDPGTKQYRYAGQFYPYQQTRFALVFTTEEDITQFDGIVVSLEDTDTPTEPSEIVAGGLLAVASPPVPGEPTP